MKYRRVLMLIIVGLIVTPSYVPLVHGAPNTRFSIVYTNDVMGEVEPCG